MKARDKLALNCDCVIRQHEGVSKLGRSRMCAGGEWTCGVPLPLQAAAANLRTMLAREVDKALVGTQFPNHHSRLMYDTTVRGLVPQQAFSSSGIHNGLGVYSNMLNTREW